MLKKFVYGLLVLVLVFFMTNISMASDVLNEIHAGMTIEKLKNTDVNIKHQGKGKDINFYKIKDTRKILWFSERNDKLICMSRTKLNIATDLIIKKFEEKAKSHKIITRKNGNKLHHFYFGNERGIMFEPNFREDLMRFYKIDVDLWNDWAKTRNEIEKFKK